MDSFAEFFSFAVTWLILMGLVGLCLWITGRFFGKKDGKTISGEEYAKRFEEEMNEPTPEKPIKKFFRNPYVLSDDEIKETKEETKE